ncbi:serine hydrolase domain-containing protein [Rhodococcus sp. B50]|uniref:serine hydrolase domain-containing protein n=1 Tax=Rhodococcus sp. B50 TaxID=2682847 RepID=UPI001BD53E53|nr:serine hydrolase domain-containing protein [Rhodococcus sp. B50]MBS9375842.1 D-alanyl-D-alanine carboxypeptidase [Rhodococcus sp. B50]
MRRLPIVLSAVILTVVTACGNDTADESPPATTSEATATDTTATGAAPAEFQDVLDRVREEVGFPGVVARVVTPEYEWTGSSGTIGADRSEKPGPDDHTRIGSITKTMTITALLQLAEDDRLSLEDPIGRYVPGLPNGEVATLGQLASMVSGIPSYTFDEEFQQRLFDDPEASWTPDELLDYVRGDAPNFAPGERFEYSNTNTIALGLVVEQVSGQSLHEYFRANVFEPLGMAETVMPTDAAITSPHLYGITEQGQPDGQTADATDWNPLWGWSAGAVISTVDNLELWGTALGTGEGILSPEMQQLRLDSFLFDIPGATDTRAYGLGLGIENGWLGHTGELPGFNTYVGYLPERRAVVVAAVNSDIPTADGEEPVTPVANQLKEIVG